MELRHVNGKRIMLFVFMVSLLAALFSLPLHAAAETAGYKPLDDAFLPDWALQQHELTRMPDAPLVIGDHTVGVVAVYDDATTQRPADYLEFYDDTGRLLAVSWFDRFGVERVAVDRGLLEKKEDLEGVFVVVLKGEDL
jgi:hypothetical protein